jgi:intein/homing endonuclease
MAVADRVFPLTEDQVNTILQEGLQRALLEADVEGNLPAEASERMAMAQTLVGMADLAYKAGSRDDDVATVLFIAEVGYQTQIVKQTGGDDVATEMTALGDETLIKIEGALSKLGEEESGEELQFVRAELERRGLRQADSGASNGGAQEPEAAAEAPEEGDTERTALEDRLTIGIMRTHGIDPSEISNLSMEGLRWVVEHPDAPADQPHVLVVEPTPSPEVAAAEEPDPGYIETVRILPAQSPASEPVTAPEDDGEETISAEREDLEGRVTGPMLKCVAVGQRVLMSDGSSRAIENVRIGDEVLSSDGVRICGDVVSGFWHSGYKEIVQIRLADGRQIRVSKEHPIYGWDRWVAAGELQLGDAICVPSVTKSAVEGSAGVSLDDAFLLALWLAEGLKNITRYQALRYTNADDGVHERVARIANERGWDVPTYANPINRSIIRRKGAPLLEGSPLEFLRGYGMNGLAVDTIHVPEAIMRSNTDVIAEFLGTYISCDGCVQMNKSGRRNGGLTVSSASERLVRDLQILSARLGVRSTVGSGESPSRRGYRVVWSWYVNTIDSIKEMSKVVVVPGKQHKFDAIMSSIELKRTYASQLPPEFRDQFKTKSPKHGPRAVIGTWITRDKALALCDLPRNNVVAEGIRELLDGGLGWARVAEIRDGGIEYTVDLETSQHHAFFLEGALTHNSFGRGRNDVPGIGDNELRFMLENPEGRVTKEQLLAARELDEVAAAGGPAVQREEPNPRLAAIEEAIAEEEAAAHGGPEAVHQPDGFAPPVAEPTPVLEPGGMKKLVEEKIAPVDLHVPEEATRDAREHFDALIKREHLPIPPDIEEEPPRLPFDMSKCSVEELYSLHARFHACEARISFLITNEEDSIGDLEKMRHGREVEVANELPTTIDRKRPTEAQRTSLIAADPQVQIYLTAEHNIAKTLRKLKVLRDSYHRDCERSSRQLTRFSQEFAGTK